MTGPKENSGFCGYTPSSKVEKNCEEIVCFTLAGSQICRGFREQDELIISESKVHVVARTTRHVTRFPPIKHVFEVIKHVLLGDLFLYRVCDSFAVHPLVFNH